jgi:toxin-antitoxin system PIN domain toxin
MTVLDVNILLYGYNADAPQHASAASWLKHLLSSGESIALPWITAWAFIRISTNPAIWPRPFTAKQAFAVIGEWIAQPGVIVLQPGPRHAELLKRLLVEYHVTGPMVTDAVLAALTLEYGATLASTDQDFRRFPELRWQNPI